MPLGNVVDLNVMARRALKDEMPGIVLRGVLSGAGSGAIILMSISMLGDTLAYDRFITGEGREGLLSSTVAVIEKTSFALGVAVLGVGIGSADLALRYAPDGHTVRRLDDLAPVLEALVEAAGLTR